MHWNVNRQHWFLISLPSPTPHPHPQKNSGMAPRVTNMAHDDKISVVDVCESVNKCHETIYIKSGDNRWR